MESIPPELDAIARIAQLLVEQAEDTRADSRSDSK
jgi:hypothetical protein